MSMINEALKKAGQPIVRKRSAGPWGPLLVLALLTLIVGLFHGPLQRVVSGDRRLAASRPLGQFAIEETAIQQPTAISSSGLSANNGAFPEFSLSGIVYSEHDSYCLINGKVLKQGDKVGGATLEKILPNRILLDYLGEKIVLRVTS